MEFNIKEKGNHILIDVQGDLKMDNFINFKTGIDNIVKKNILNIDFNMKHTDFIDSSNLRLLINLKKRLTKVGGDMILINISPQVKSILETTNLEKVFKIFNSEDEYDNFIIDKGADKGFNFWAVANKDGDIIRTVTLKCGVCGSLNAIGYTLNPKYKKKTWVGGNYLPTFGDLKQGSENDFFRSAVAVCADCLMASTNLDDFTVIEDGKEIKKMIMDIDTKNILAKSIGKRKKIVNMEELTIESFKNPRTDEKIHLTYMLAVECARSLSFDRSKADAFHLAYLNIITAEYSKTTDEANYLDRARAWLAQVLEKPEKHDKMIVAESFYYMFMCCSRLNKKKEAKQVIAQFEQYAESITDNILQKTTNFWLDRANEIWNQQIQDDSTAFSTL